jgi:GMP synthase (glutamine-hydrolysing)
MKPILFVRCDVVDTFGIAPSAVTDGDADVRVWDAIDPATERPEIEEVGGIVVFGSTYNVEHADEQPFIKEVRELTREAVESGVPVLGSCFGAQMVAWALDAQVGRSPVREVGFEPIRTTAAAAGDPLLRHWSDGDMGFQWHMDTFELPTGAELLATGDGVANQAYRVGERAWGIQWHFEIDAAELELWLDEYASAGGDIEREWGKTNDQVRDEARRFMSTHERKGRETFGAFVEQVRAATR